MLDRLDDLREDLGHNDFADDVGGAKKGMEQPLVAGTGSEAA